MGGGKPERQKNEEEEEVMTTAMVKPLVNAVTGFADVHAIAFSVTHARIPTQTTAINSEFQRPVIQNTGFSSSDTRRQVAWRRVNKSPQTNLLRQPYNLSVLGTC
jgi:hypothetical protein